MNKIRREGKKKRHKVELLEIQSEAQHCLATFVSNRSQLDYWEKLCEIPTSAATIYIQAVQEYQVPKWRSAQLSEETAGLANCHAGTQWQQNPQYALRPKTNLETRELFEFPDRSDLAKL